MRRTRSALGACGVAVALAWSLGCDSQWVKGNAIGLVADAGPPSSACGILEACCPSLPAEVVASCQHLALEVGTDECSAEATALRAAGYCPVTIDAGTQVDAAVRPDATAPTDGGPRTDAGPADGGVAIACTLLQSCCQSSSLPAGEAATCTSIQGGGDESVCAGELSTLVASQSCTGTSYGSGGACPEMQQCCESASFPAAFLTACLDALAEGDDPTCATDLAAYMQAGYCGGEVPSADGGTQMGADCMALALCCEAITFPLETLGDLPAHRGRQRGGQLRERRGFVRGAGVLRREQLRRGDGSARPLAAPTLPLPARSPLALPRSGGGKMGDGC